MVLSARAGAVHRSGPNIDLHLDTLLWERLLGYDLSKRHRNWFPRSPFGFHSDLPRMLEGGMSGAFFGLHSWPFAGESAYVEIVRQIEGFHKLAGRDARIRYGCTPEHFEAGHRDSVIVGCLGVEGAHAINGKLERVEFLYEAGVRYMTLAHFNRNRAATPAMGVGANEREGLSGFGRELVAEMNRIGMIVDCAHLNERCRLEVCEQTTRPVMVTHTGVKGVVDHRRNISDASIEAVAATGGIIGIMFAPVFTSGRLLGTTAEVVAHVEHVVKVAGIEHVAVGTDLDGFIPTLPKEIRDMSDFPIFTECLTRGAWTDTEIRMILGGNVLKFLSRYQETRENGSLPEPGSARDLTGNQMHRHPFLDLSQRAGMLGASES
ncbi:MAG: hypothetical protein AUK47_04800 [Deltaproteobacteria bacterium CG2_30_63_29]|nr:MAG: hypothetical protein AUK47_04800 [Deltaproteobacteria bacterium CG2_30_63_29]PIV99188.1 MAG: peptidase [Deltaproteobacteria bacterium CG17_big_fil_post_rev_8_21_14_2_50_63_7]PJB42963.1 MAG: peptidase [Deltaproteobacteria bacterium CG_4_9_14_3_um_filter_63_12]